MNFGLHLHSNWASTCFLSVGNVRESWFVQRLCFIALGGEKLMQDPNFVCTRVPVLIEPS